ncbi:MAG TPA: GGDEF domain-containing protein [Acidocella sp.]|nr:GGDEF domain-containing protein [Acidocella sp.]
MTQADFDTALHSQTAPHRLPRQKHPAHFKPLIEGLLRTRVRDLKLPPELATLYKARSLKISRAIMISWCLWVAAINVFAGLFDLFDMTGTTLMIVLGFRGLVSVSFLLSASLLKRDLLARREHYLIIIPSVVCVISAGLAGRVSGQQDIAGGYIISALLVIYSAVMFINIDFRYGKLLAILSIILVAGFMFTTPGGEFPAKLQRFSLYGAAMVGLLVAHRIQLHFQHRLFLITLRDEMAAAEAANAHAELSNIAYIDRLTDIPNRRYFDEICATLSKTTQNLLPLSICMIDIDKFKNLNDSTGHLQGDHCLRMVANEIRAHLRGKTDILIRFGGDEFLLLLPGTDTAHATDIADRMRTAIAALQLENPGSPFGIITASIGIATQHSQPVKISQLIEQADTALYRAKSTGRNRACQ